MPTSLPVSPPIRRIRLGKSYPTINIDDLALMLEIDLLLRDRKSFSRRLHLALEDAFKRGGIGSR